MGAGPPAAALAPLGNADVAGVCDRNHDTARGPGGAVLGHGPVARPVSPAGAPPATEVINKLNHAHQYRLSRDSLDSGHCHGAAAQSRHLLHPFPEKLLFGTALTSRRLGWYYFGSRSRSRLPSSSVISE